MNIKGIAKVFAAIFGLSFILTLTQPVQAKNVETKIVSNSKSEIYSGIYVDLENIKGAKIINRDGIIYLQVKPIIEKLGYKTNETKTSLTIEKDSKKIKLALGSNTYYENEKPKKLSTNNPICGVNFTAYAPKEFFEEEFDCKVKVVDSKETGYVGKDPSLKNWQHYYMAPEKAVFIGKGLDKVKESNFDNLVPTNSDKIEIYKDGFILKGKKFYLTPFNDAGIIYVPADIIAENMGASLGADNRFLFGNIVHTPDNIEIKYNNKKLYFQQNWEYYRVNDSLTRPLISRNDSSNLKKSTVLYRAIKGEILGHMNYYVPINVLQREFNWKFEVKENITMIPKPTNKNRGLSEGWVCPKLKSKSTNNFKKDLETLSKELELDFENAKDWDYINSEFDPYPDYCSGATTFIAANKKTDCCSILLKGYYYRSNKKDDFCKEYLGKSEYINQQIIKFFFPTKWQYMHNELMKKDSKNLLGKHKWDGREVMITRGDYFHIDFSKVGGKLKRDH